MKHISTRISDSDHQWLSGRAEEIGTNVSAALRSAIEQARAEDGLIARLEALLDRQAEKIASASADRVITRLAELRKRQQQQG